MRVQKLRQLPIELRRVRDRAHMPHVRQHFVLGMRDGQPDNVGQATRDSHSARAADEQHRHAEKRQLVALKRLAKQSIELLDHRTYARGDRSLPWRRALIPMPRRRTRSQ